ncbi:MAG: hypothetical protein U5K33_05950 [Halofilum sp. (in: g-proteobacteria)]|nr:hypothetical protein [Halofilum sp. (in: g-proteobacteria)]
MWPNHLLALASEFACVIDAEGAVRAVSPRWHLPQRAATLFEWFDPEDHVGIRAAIDAAPRALEGGTARARLVPGNTPTEVRIGRIDRGFLLVTLLPIEPPGVLANCIVRSAGRRPGGDGR